MRRVLVLVISFLCLVMATEAFAGANVQQMRQQRQRAEQQRQQQIQQQIAVQRQAQLQQQVTRQAQQQAYQRAARQRQQQIAQQAIVQQQKVIVEKVVQRRAQQIAQQRAIAARRAQEVQVFRQAQAIKQGQAVRRQAIQQSAAQQYAQHTAQQRVNIVQKKAFEVQRDNVVRELAKRNSVQKAKAFTARKAVHERLYAREIAERRQKIEEKKEEERKAKQIVTDVANEAEIVPEEKEEEQIVNIEDLWDSLEKSGQAWNLIMDDEIKAITIKKYLDEFKQQGIIIRNPPGHYVKMIDGMAQNEGDAILDNSIQTIVQVIAIMEYDFDNGIDKEQLAKRVLGDNAYAENRKRILSR